MLGSFRNRRRRWRWCCQLLRPGVAVDSVIIGSDEFHNGGDDETKRHADESSTSWVTDSL